MDEPRIAGFASLPDNVRCFIALRLEAAVEDTIAAIIERLRAHETDAHRNAVRWVRRENFHLTLFFLGPAVARDRLEPVAEALHAISRTTSPFEVAVRGLGGFPNLTRPQIIWVGLNGDELIAMAARVAQAVGRCGFAPERRAYMPHLTIGRARARLPERLRQMLIDEANFSFGVSRIERVTLYRSETRPQASIYHEIAGFPLGAPEAG